MLEIFGAVGDSLLLAAQNIDIQVDPGAGKGQLPGTNTAQEFANGIAFYALIFVIVGAVLSGGLWALGAFSNNYTQSINGKRGFLICIGAAFAIGAANVLIDWFYGAGNDVN